MSDLAPTAANVVAQSGSVVEYGVAGATITAGKLLYQDPADNKLKLVDSDDASAVKRAVYGMALNSGDANQPMAVLKRGPVAMGAILTVGQIYVASDTAGGIMPAADLEAGDYVSTVGIAISASVLNFQIQNSGVAVPA